MRNKEEQIKALKELKNLCKNGSKNRVIYTQVTRVSQSGMSRHIKFYVFKRNYLYNITGEIARACGYSWDYDGVKIGGCGMDMIFNTLYNVNSWAIEYKIIKPSKKQTKHDLHYQGIVNTNYWSL